MVSRQCTEHSRGTAMGVYSTSQFSGAFFGGIVSGYLVQLGEPQAIFLVLAGLSILWLVAVLGMRTGESLNQNMDDDASK